MTRKEKIIEILKSNIHLSFIEDELTGSDHPAMTHKYHSELNGFEQSADAILAIPIEIPSEEEINEYARRESIVQVEQDGELIDYESCLDEYYIVGAKWAIEQTIKRNGKET